MIREKVLVVEKENARLVKALLIPDKVKAVKEEAKSVERNKSPECELKTEFTQTPVKEDKSYGRRDWKP